jgi:hypothetical protein
VDSLLQQNLKKQENLNRLKIDNYLANSTSNKHRLKEKKNQNWNFK